MHINFFIFNKTAKLILFFLLVDCRLPSQAEVGVYRQSQADSGQLRRPGNILQKVIWVYNGDPNTEHVQYSGGLNTEHWNIEHFGIPNVLKF